jgi:hypothetical protein
MDAARVGSPKTLDGKSWTKLADGVLAGPPDAPDEVIDVEHYNRAMQALTNADARVNGLEGALTKIADPHHLRRLSDARRIAREALDKRK